MNKISIRGSLQTKQIVGSYSDVEKKIIADLDSVQEKDGKKNHFQRLPMKWLLSHTGTGRMRTTHY